MKRVKEYYEISINNELKLIQVIRTEKKKERNTDGKISADSASINLFNKEEKK